jgi:hypothetical protein
MSAAKTLRLALGGLGAAVLGFGVFGLLTEPAVSDPAAVGQWLVLGLLAHDALLAPFVFLLCALAFRITGARWRGRLAALLLIGGSLVLISVPALLQKGRNPNPTVLPLDYARNLATLLAVLVAAMALYGGLDAARRRRSARRATVGEEKAADPGDDEGGGERNGAADDADTGGDSGEEVQET